MALNAYLTMVGQKSGKIQGSVTQKGREGSEVIAASHEIFALHDPASGMATGKRQHKPLVVTKVLDRATPALREVLTTNEVLTEVGLAFYKIDAKGAEVRYFTIKLTNALIDSIDMEMPNNKHADLAKLETFEDVAFAYEKIEWTWTDTVTVVADDWAAPAV